MSQIIASAHLPHCGSSRIGQQKYAAVSSRFANPVVGVVSVIGDDVISGSRVANASPFTLGSLVVVLDADDVVFAEVAAGSTQMAGVGCYTPSTNHNEIA
jgi:hypothetical protein